MGEGYGKTLIIGVDHHGRHLRNLPDVVKEVVETWGCCELRFGTLLGVPGEFCREAHARFGGRVELEAILPRHDAVVLPYVKIERVNVGNWVEIIPSLMQNVGLVVRLGGNGFTDLEEDAAREAGIRVVAYSLEQGLLQAEGISEGHPG